MRSPTFTLWLESEQWMEEGAPIDFDNNFCNITVTLADGRVYALNVWTYAYCHQAMTEQNVDADRLGGLYLTPPDLLVTRLDRKVIEAVIADLLHREAMRREWLVDRSSGVE